MKPTNQEQFDTENNLVISILMGSPHMIITLNSIRDAQGNIVDFEFALVNVEFRKIFGKEDQVLKGKRFFEVFDEENWSDEFSMMRDYAMKEAYFKIEKEIRIGEKNLTYMISGVHFQEALALHFIDINVIRKSLDTVKEKEKKYQALFQNCIDPVFVLDKEFRITEFNIPFSRMFGVDEEQLQMNNILDLISSDKKFRKMLERLKKDKKSVEMELRLTNSKGKQRDCIIHAAPVSYTREDPLYLGVIRDYTERKKAEKEIIFAEKMATTGKLARIIAHEVRNPLTNINLALSELQSELPSDNPDIKYYLDMIRRNSERIQVLTRDFLNSSRAKELKFEKRNINKVIGETLEFVRDRIDLKEMTLKENFSPDLPDVNVDPEQIKVGLLNLLLNAVEAMKPGRGILEVSTSKEGDDVLIRIKDNGKGIDAKDLDLIFDPFYSIKKDGTGLGLTVTKNIITGHKGSINVESERGKGTLFTISLPVN